MCRPARYSTTWRAWKCSRGRRGRFTGAMLRQARSTSSAAGPMPRARTTRVWDTGISTASTSMPHSADASTRGCMRALRPPMSAARRCWRMSRVLPRLAEKRTSSAFAFRHCSTAAGRACCCAGTTSKTEASTRCLATPRLSSGSIRSSRRAMVCRTATTPSMACRRSTRRHWVIGSYSRSPRSKVTARITGSTSTERRRLSATLR